MGVGLGWPLRPAWVRRQDRQRPISPRTYHFSITLLDWQVSDRPLSSLKRLILAGAMVDPIPLNRLYKKVRQNGQFAIDRSTLCTA
jgi:hypothetical protein